MPVALAESGLIGLSERCPRALGEPSKTDCLFITDEHIDHIGCIPELIKAEFRGEIILTIPLKSFSCHA